MWGDVPYDLLYFTAQSTWGGIPPLAAAAPGLFELHWYTPRCCCCGGLAEGVYPPLLQLQRLDWEGIPSLAAALANTDII